MVALNEKQRFLKQRVVYQRDPISFMVNVLDVDPNYVWPKMRELAESVRDNPFTVCSAGHSVSKTYTLGRLALWFLYSFRPSTVVTTGPGFSQIAQQIWREIRTAHANAKIKLGGNVTQTMIDLQQATGKKWFAVGFSTRPDTVTAEATKFQGYHNEHILVIFDEAAGILPEIWRAAEHLLTSGFYRFVAVGNPTNIIGDFRKCFEDPRFNKIQISVKDSPNYKTGKEIIPGVAGKEYERRMRLKYGEDHRQYKIRVLGEFAGFAVDGTYYAPNINKLKEKKPPQIGLVPHDPSYLVHTGWDIGYTMAIWFFQIIGLNPHFLRYYEDSGPGIGSYVDYLQELKIIDNYRYGKHFAPFDVDSNAQRSTTGKTVREIAKELGLHFTVLRVRRDVLEAIENVKKVLPHCWFDREKCGSGLESLRVYHEKKNERMSTEDRPYFLGYPEKDWSAHGADAFDTSVRGMKKIRSDKNILTEDDIKQLQIEAGLV